MSEFATFSKGLRQEVDDSDIYTLEEKVNYVRSKMHKTWNHQQKKIDKLEEANQIMTSVLLDLLQNLPCDHKYASECTACGIDAVLARYGDYTNISLRQRLEKSDYSQK